MARHRNIRKLDYNEEYGYDDVYGKSLEEEVAISPSTAAQFLYHRESQEAPSLKSYFDSREVGTNPPQVSPVSPLATTTTTMSPTPLSSRDVSQRRPGQHEPETSGSTHVHPRVPPGFKPIEQPTRVPPGFQPLGGVPIKITTEDTSQSLGGPTPVGGVTLSVPVKSLSAPVKVSSSNAAKRGFVTSLSVDEDRTRSGSSSPARSPSPDHTPHSTPTPSRHPPPQRSTSRPKHQQIDVVSEYKKREESSKRQVNLVVIGHVDAGKSTLMGHLLYLLGHVSKKSMHKYELESQKVGKGSFAYAWVLDETGEERNRGITMDVAQQEFETQNMIVTLLDAPGHRDFIPNMITGAAQADVAILVVDAAVGEFESGFEAGGQTREHAILVRSLGVRQLTVAVNKMDTVDWSESRFNEILQKLKAYLKQAGFRDSDVNYVPCSGLKGENLVKRPTVRGLTDWYNGPTLLERIDLFTPPPRPVEKPFRCCIADIFRAQGAGFSIAGRIESGHLQQGDSVLVLPANEVANIKAVLVSGDTCSWAVAGDQVIVTLSGVDMAKVNVGNVLCSQENPVKVTNRIEARIIVFNIDIPITIGFPVLFHYQSLNEPAVVKKLVSLLNKSSGELIKRKPRCIMKQSTAVVELEVMRPVCLELYQDCKDLGRFMLRTGGSTIAAGVVTKIL